MSATNETVMTCQGCGATIYPEQLENHTAERYAGKLYCQFCLNERKPPGGGVTGGAALDATKLGGMQKQSQYRRGLLAGSPHATRCKTFHCKLADGPLVSLNDQINEWIDMHDEVEVKFATTVVGVVEGKHNDPHLIVTIFY
ncbi:MAG: hypothetical protein JNG88_03785 [Phycisphaerales bacterium]|nr:hypothetical protein [Phycisphaerales bacterium]